MKSTEQAEQFKALEKGQAVLSDDRVYRYALSRVWDNAKPSVLYIGLNPSTADEAQLDPTLRRAVRFAMREGFGGFYMGNLFAFRATVPRVMLLQKEPVGPANDFWLRMMAREAGKVIGCWGAHGKHMNRDAHVKTMLRDLDIELYCFGITKDRQPRHPLYLRADTPLEVLR